MATLIPDQEFAQRTPALLVENSLAPGAWTFRLVAVDDDGNASDPQTLTINVRRRIVRPPPPDEPGRTVPGRPFNPHVFDTTPIVDATVATPGRVRPVLDPHVIIRRPG